MESVPIGSSLCYEFLLFGDTRSRYMHCSALQGGCGIGLSEKEAEKVLRDASEWSGLEHFSSYVGDLQVWLLGLCWNYVALMIKEVVLCSLWSTKVLAEGDPMAQTHFWEIRKTKDKNLTGWIMNSKKSNIDCLCQILIKNLGCDFFGSASRMQHPCATHHGCGHRKQV